MKTAVKCTASSRLMIAFSGPDSRAPCDDCDGDSMSIAGLRFAISQIIDAGCGHWQAFPLAQGEPASDAASACFLQSALKKIKKPAASGAAGCGNIAFNRQ